MPDRPPVATCKSCSEPIIWATTSEGRRMPVDIEPVDGGNLQLSAGPTPVATVVSRTGRHPGQKLHTSHFATCPRADRHRRRVDDQRRARETHQQQPGRPDLFTEHNQARRIAQAEDRANGHFDDPSESDQAADTYERNLRGDDRLTD